MKFPRLTKDDHAWRRDLIRQGMSAPDAMAYVQQQARDREQQKKRGKK